MQSVLSLVALEVIINIAVVTSTIPATGMPLPFFSYGGTSMVFLLTSIGILLNISRGATTNVARMPVARSRTYVRREFS